MHLCLYSTWSYSSPCTCKAFAAWRGIPATTRRSHWSSVAPSPLGSLYLAALSRCRWPPVSQSRLTGTSARQYRLLPLKDAQERKIDGIIGDILNIDWASLILRSIHRSAYQSIEVALLFRRRPSPAALTHSHLLYQQMIHSFPSRKKIR